MAEQKKTEAQLNNLKNQKTSKENQKTELENENTKLRNEISRLEKARNRLNSYIEELRGYRKSGERKVKEKISWKGSNYNSYKSSGENLMCEGLFGNNSSYLGQYIKSVDTIRDDLNLLITEKQNKIYKNEGLIGQLKSAINTLKTKITNFWN